uniref:Leucine-rich repeat-containing N-terminal plant-type domain-containing protein n=1 Tax=Oryza barthii TaxID=65489 RepID=A0A0D3F3L4_9ORYZ
MRRLVASQELLLVLLISLQCLSCLAIANPALDRQAEALLQWKSGLRGDLSYCGLEEWSNATSPCNWSGIYCSYKVRRGHERDAILVVTNITLFSCNISGGLSKLRFAQLPRLVFLDLSINSLYGPIPSDIDRLAELSYLDLSNNKLTGSIPPSIGNLRSLIKLDLSTNEITGSIPESIGNLTSLQNMDLSNNRIIGPIPSTFSKLKSLITLKLESNVLNAILPPELGFLRNLLF